MNKSKNNERKYPIIEIHNLGPIKDCELIIDKFTVATGPQASGKSTIAKAVYYCETIKNEIFTQLTMPSTPEIYEVLPQKGIEKRLRGKFLKVFGSTWAMPMDMEIVYKYAPKIQIKVYLAKDTNDEDKNFVEVEFCKKIKDFITNKSKRQYESMEDKLLLKQDLDALFQRDYDCIFIPAGRGMITLLTDQLNYIFNGIDEIAVQTVDYCTRSYVENILKMRSIMTDGLRGLLNEKLEYTQDIVDKNIAEQMLSYCDDVLKGQYYYVAGEERLQISNDRYVKLNYTSSGQQETVWVFNVLFYYILNRKKILLIIEEPEAHLYPDAQQTIAKALALFGNYDKEVFVTTHSPYILGEFNNLLYASRVSKDNKSLEKVISSNCILDYKKAQAVYLNNGKSEVAIEDGLILSELIDGASESINSEHDEIMQIIWDEEEENK